MIPAFELSGVLPPFTGSDPTVRTQTSPYATNILELVQRFATSHERAEILRGLIGYRQALNALGIVRGVQYLDGSFVEEVEKLRGRPPGDIDVITFAKRPRNLRTKVAFNQMIMNNVNLFHPTLAKATFKCDAYVIDMDDQGLMIADSTRYFFSLFSHQKGTRIWKGVLAIPVRFGPDDIQALAHLNGTFP